MLHLLTTERPDGTLQRLTPGTPCSSGKTVAFGVPAIEHILSLGPAAGGNSGKKGKSAGGAPVSVLIICPTRELAMQTHQNLNLISKTTTPAVPSVCLYGGVPKPEQIRILRNERPRIVVGTPGRLLDLAREGNLDLGKVSWLVLDEADRMLDKGFENDIREIIKLCLPSPESKLGPIKEERGEPKFRRVSAATRFRARTTPCADYAASRARGHTRPPCSLRRGRLRSVASPPTL